MTDPKSSRITQSGIQISSPPMSAESLITKDRSASQKTFFDAYWDLFVDPDPRIPLWQRVAGGAALPGVGLFTLLGAKCSSSNAPGTSSDAGIACQADTDCPSEQVCRAGWCGPPVENPDAAVGTPAIRLVPPNELDFGAPLIGYGTTTLALTVLSEGSAPLEITRLTIEENDALKEYTSNPQEGPLDWRIEADQNRAIQVTLVPLDAEADIGQLCLDWNNPAQEQGKGVVCVDLKSEIKGTAELRACVLDVEGEDPRADCDPMEETIDFGEVTLGDMASRVVAFHNGGTENQPLIIDEENDVFLAGTGATLFSRELYEDPALEIPASFPLYLNPGNGTTPSNLLFARVGFESTLPEFVSDMSTNLSVAFTANGVSSAEHIAIEARAGGCPPGFVDLDEDPANLCECEIAPEVCDDLDNDCDGEVDGWTRTYNGPADAEDVGMGIAVGPDGNSYVTGVVIDPVEGQNIVIYKHDPAGNLLWTVTYDGPASGSDVGRGIAVAPDGGSIYVIGWVTVLGQGHNIWIRKMDSDGNEIWTRTYNGPANEGDDGIGIAVAPDGESIYVIGNTTVADGGEDIWIQKMDSDGNEIWTRTYNGPANGADRGYGIAVAPDGGSYATGYTTVADGGKDIWTQRMDSDGNVIWTETYNGPANGSDEGHGIAVAPDGGSVYVIGHTTVDGEDANIFFNKYDSDGNQDPNPNWPVTYNNVVANGQDIGFGITLDLSGHVYVTGFETTLSQDHNVLNNKYDTDGNQVIGWPKTYDGSDHLSDEGHSIAVDSGHLYVTGFETVTGQYPNIWFREDICTSP